MKVYLWRSNELGGKIIAKSVDKVLEIAQRLFPAVDLDNIIVKEWKKL
ncbi:MAG: hypothetical protein RR416_03115 [Clostridia bacterium]